MLARFSLFNSALAFIAAFGWFYADAWRLMLEFDATRMSVVICAIYLLTTAFIGFRLKDARRGAVFVAAWLPAFGILGSVIGAVLLLHSGNLADTQTGTEFARTLIAGMSTVMVATAAGIAGMILLMAQIWFVTWELPE
jgi:hypothetical protein